MSYLGNSPGVASQRVESAFTATASQTVFTPTSGYTLGYCDVYLNGIKLVNGDDYTASNGTSITLATAASEGDSIVIVASFPRGLSDGYLKAEADAKYVAKTGSTMTGDLVLDNGNADGAQLQLASSGYSNWNLDNYSGRLRAYYGATEYFSITNSGVLSLAGSANFGNNAVSTHVTRFSGFGLSDGTNRYGSYGQMLLHSTSSWTGSARRYLITNGYLGYNLAFIRSVDANTDPALGNNGTVSSGTVDLMLDPTGNLTLATGNLVMSSGKGIDFSANSNLSGVGSEVLDDYEHGSFTPTIDSGSGLGGLTAGTCFYTKVGKLVSIYGTFTYTSASAGTAFIVFRTPFNHNTASGPNVCGVANAYPYDNNRQSGIVIDNSSGDAYGTYIGVYVSSSSAGNVYFSLTYQSA